MSVSIYERARQLRKNQTPPESFFWRQVRKRKILECLFLRQYVIEYPDKLNKHSFFIVDFYCNELRLIVEIDGEIHKYQIEEDKMRESILVEMNFTIIRFNNIEVLKNWDFVESKLREKIFEIRSLRD